MSFVPPRKVRTLLQHHSASKLHSEEKRRTACGVDRVYRCYSLSFNKPYGCTTYILTYLLTYSMEQSPS
jgi:hypothetical protein